ncbi:4818_t:CDS:2, partial [Acaulospora morrowiae]
MEISHGTPVFLQEIVTNPEEWIGKEIRVVGSLIYHNIESEVGVLQQYLERKENFLVVDTNLVERSHNWNM